MIQLACSTNIEISIGARELLRRVQISPDHLHFVSKTLDCVLSGLETDPTRSSYVSND